MSKDIYKLYKPTIKDMETIFAGLKDVKLTFEHDGEYLTNKGIGNSFYGKTHTVETKKIISEKLKKRVNNWGHKVKKSLQKFYETNDSWHKGKTLTNKHKQKISEGQKGRVSPMKGKKHSEETRQKMSNARKGRVSTMKGKKHSAESKEKIGQAVRQAALRRRQSATKV